MRNKDIQTAHQAFASSAPINFDSPWAQRESDWPAIKDIALLACMAALFHDFRKANAAFQRKLVGAGRKADAYRHEWVSLRLFEAFVRRSGATIGGNTLPASRGRCCSVPD